MKEVFKNLLESYWQEVFTDRGEFIKWIEQESHSNETLKSFLEYIHREKNEPGYLACSPYLKLLNSVQSDIESIIEQRIRKLIENQEKNTKFLKARYYEAVREILKEGSNIFEGRHNYEARQLVHGAIVYIGREISETNRCGTEELIYRIKAIPDYKANDTLNIALEIMESWIEWMNNRPNVLVSGPEMTKNSIKKAILSRYSKVFSSCDTALSPPHVTSWRIDSSGNIEKIEESIKETTISYWLHVFKGLLEENWCDCFLAQNIHIGKEFIEWIEWVSQKQYHDLILDSFLNHIQSEKSKRSGLGIRIGSLFSNFLDAVESIIKAIRDIKKPEPKPKETFKPGDKVFFIKQSVIRESQPDFRRFNLYLGTVKDWSVSSEGVICCKFDNSFNIMSIESLELNVEYPEEVKTLIESDDFSKAIIKSNTTSVYGDITLCPVDESMFPKLNKILEKFSNQ